MYCWEATLGPSTEATRTLECSGTSTGSVAIQVQWTGRIARVSKWPNCPIDLGQEKRWLGLTMWTCDIVRGVPSWPRKWVHWIVIQLIILSLIDDIVIIGHQLSVLPVWGKARSSLNLPLQTDQTNTSCHQATFYDIGIVVRRYQLFLALCSRHSFSMRLFLFFSFFILYGLLRWPHRLDCCIKLPVLCCMFPCTLNRGKLGVACTCKDSPEACTNKIQACLWEGCLNSLSISRYCMKDA